MAEVTGGAGADTVAVDIEDLEDGVSQQSPISLDDDGEEASFREVTHVLHTWVDEEFEDCVYSDEANFRTMSDDDDDSEEAYITFRREDLNPVWVASIKQKNLVEPKILRASSASKSCSIHRAPCWLPKDNSNSYRPQLISIGPYHYKERKCQLRAMEEHKRRYLQGICDRKREGWLEGCLTTIKRWEKRARNYYSEVIPLNSSSFVEMMVLDGCFLVELFRNFGSKKDVIIKLNWPRETMNSDLILMENQIPFFILKHLSRKIDASVGDAALVKSALNFLRLGDSTSALVEKITDPNFKIRHLLHLVYEVHTHTISINCRPSSGRPVWIPCASRLKEGGIKFKRRDAGGDHSEVFNVKFDKGVIEIPRISVGYQSKIKFLNFIVFEQCYPHSPKYMTSYFYFMDCLINTAKDVEILSSEGIIEEALGSEELVASHFNNMSRGTLKYIGYLYLSEVCNDINRYRGRWWPKKRASLMHNYFNNPWAIISFLAALLLLLVAMIQTFFTSFPKFAYGN